MEIKQEMEEIRLLILRKAGGDSNHTLKQSVEWLLKDRPKTKTCSRCKKGEPHICHDCYMNLLGKAKPKTEALRELVYWLDTMSLKLVRNGIPNYNRVGNEAKAELNQIEESRP